MEHGVKREPGSSGNEEEGGQILYSAANIKLEITFPSSHIVPVEFESRTDAGGDSQYTGCVKMEKEVKSEAESPVGSSDRKFDVDIEISLPNIKQECLEYSRKVDQHTVLGWLYCCGPGQARMVVYLPVAERVDIVRLARDAFNGSSLVVIDNLSRLQDSVLMNPALSSTIFKKSKKPKITKSFRIASSGMKLFSCLKCSYASDYKSKLTRHMLVHSVEKPFSCAHCTYTSNNKCSLKQHMLRHDAGKPFSCSECGYSCNRKSNLIKHMVTHTAEKPFSCSECSYKCKRKRDLINHQRTHSGVKPFSCTQCTFSFYNKGNLSSHVLTHSEEKPFACTECEYRCKRKRDLIIHRLIHCTEKPFACAECDYKCIRQSNLRIHMHKHLRPN